MSVLSEIVNRLSKQRRAEFNHFSAADFNAVKAQGVRTPLSIFKRLEKKQFIFLAECKKASPAVGIIKQHYDYLKLAEEYKRAGADGVSILTEENYFNGHLKHLAQVRKALSDTVLLKKDFIIHPLQIAEGYEAGADLILLLAAVLSEERLLGLAEKVLELGMTPLIELYAAEEVEKVRRVLGRLRAHPAHADKNAVALLGINNRNLKTFETDLAHGKAIKQLLPADELVISESGIKTTADLKQLKALGFRGALIGETFLTSPAPGKTLKTFIEAVK